MTSKSNKKTLLCYIPVIHRGYLELIEETEATELGVYADEVISKFDYLRKDIRALSPVQAVKLLNEYLNIEVKLIDEKSLKELATRKQSVVMPQDDISKKISAKYLSDKKVEYYPIFLRWDRDNSAVNIEANADSEIEADDTSAVIIRTLYNEVKQSSDWWRQVGAAIIKDGEILAATHNQHQPTQYSNWIDGDPRNAAKRGESIDAATAQHAEAALIANAAKTGTPLAGAEIYVTTFPCPTCAKMIANSGIGKCYFIEGYAMTDGQRVLKQNDVEIIKLKTKAASNLNSKSYPYPKKRT